MLFTSVFFTSTALKNISGKPAQDWLREHPKMQSLTASRQPLLALQTCLDQIAQELRLPVVPLAVRLDSDVLTLSVPSAAHAAKLRQSGPSLLRLLGERVTNAGVKISRIHYRPQAASVALAPVVREITPIPSQALQAFRAMSSRNANPKMSLALERLLKRHGG